MIHPQINLRNPQTAQWWRMSSHFNRHLPWPGLARALPTGDFGGQGKGALASPGRHQLSNVLEEVQFVVKLANFLHDCLVKIWVMIMMSWQVASWFVHVFCFFRAQRWSRLNGCQAVLGLLFGFKPMLLSLIPMGGGRFACDSAFGLLRITGGRGGWVAIWHGIAGIAATVDVLPRFCIEAYWMSTITNYCNTNCTFMSTDAPIYPCSKAENCSDWGMVIAPQTGASTWNHPSDHCLAKCRSRACIGGAPSGGKGDAVGSKAYVIGSSNMKSNF